MSTKLFDKWTLVLHHNGSIFAASQWPRNNEEDDSLVFLVFELNLILDVVKKFEARDDVPNTIDANENYLAIGYWCSPYVDVYSRKELDRNGTCKKVVVS